MSSQSLCSLKDLQSKYISCLELIFQSFSPHLHALFFHFLLELYTLMRIIQSLILSKDFPSQITSFFYLFKIPNFQLLFFSHLFSLLNFAFWKYFLLPASSQKQSYWKMIVQDKDRPYPESMSPSFKSFLIQKVILFIPHQQKVSNNQLVHTLIVSLLLEFHYSLCII